MRWTIFHKGLLVLALPLAFWIGLIIVLSHLLQQAELETQREARARALISCIDDVRKDATDAGFAGAMYMYTRQPTLWQRYLEKSDLADENIQLGKELTKGHPQEEAMLAAVEAGHAEAKRFMKEASKDPDRLRALAASRGERDLGYDKMRLYGDRLLESIRTTKNESSESQRRARSAIKTALIGGVCFNALLTVFLIFVFSRAITGRLKFVMDNTRRLLKRQPLNAQVDGTDEIAELDKVLHSTAKELHELEQFKKELTAMVSHELRTPLTSIQGALSLLRMGALGEIPTPARNYVEIAESNSIRLIRLVNELLDIEKMEAGKLEMSISPTSLRSVCLEAIQAVRDFGLAHHVTIKHDCPEVTVDADGERIVQVLINLLSNAIKYSPPHSEVLLEAHLSGAMVEIRVIDSGRGIPQEFLHKVFDKFEQVDPLDRREKRGTGLGLAICKMIVLQHNGEIGVNSQEGQGSTFWFRIPATTRQREADEAAVEAAQQLDFTR